MHRTKIGCIVVVLLAGFAILFSWSIDNNKKSEELKLAAKRAEWATRTPPPPAPVDPCSFPHVAKKDGTFDPRKNDLWELANDWIFFRGQALIGKEGAARSFQQTNFWLNQYPNDRVHEAITLAEKCRSGK